MIKWIEDNAKKAAGFALGIGGVAGWVVKHLQCLVS